tara:strand:- start:22852 stop:24216 length:1365 start_codon:yes stop_codon:yes gene_type:complete
MAEEDEIIRDPIAQLQSRTAGLIRARRQKRVRALETLFGVREDPTTTEMARFNEQLRLSGQQLTTLAEKVYDSQEARLKSRRDAVTNFLQEARMLINQRSQAATGHERTRLSAMSTLFGKMISGAQAADKAEAKRAAKGGPLPDYKLKSTIAGILRGATNKNTTPVQAGQKIVEKIPDPAQREEARQRIQAGLKAAGLGPSMALVERGIKMQEEAENFQLDNETLLDVGINPADQEDVMAAQQGAALVTGNADLQTLFIENEEYINNSRPSFGGSLPAVMAEIASAMSSGRTQDMQQALDGLLGEINMSAEDAAQIDNYTERHKMLMDKMLDPNAPSAVQEARTALIQDPAYQTMKREMGWQTDSGMIKYLTRQAKMDRRLRRKNDRLLNKSVRLAGPSPEALAAMRTLQENADKARQEQKDKLAKTKSATLAQQPEPEDTTVKTGGSSGGGIA